VFAGGPVQARQPEAGYLGKIGRQQALLERRRDLGPLRVERAFSTAIAARRPSSAASARSPSANVRPDSAIASDSAPIGGFSAIARGTTMTSGVSCARPVRITSAAPAANSRPGSAGAVATCRSSPSGEMLSSVATSANAGTTSSSSLATVFSISSMPSATSPAAASSSNRSA
jgi:hypothetical protein